MCWVVFVVLLVNDLSSGYSHGLWLKYIGCCWVSGYNIHRLSLFGNSFVHLVW